MKKKLSTLDLTLASMFVALMAIGANITSWVPFMTIGTVPITLQTFFALLAGMILGSRLGAISMTVYALVGLAGVPVFAKAGGGVATIFSSTFGFIISFIFTAYVVGKIAEKSKSLPVLIAASLAGLVVNYVFGTNWMYFALKFWAAAPPEFSYKIAWLWMVLPAIKDTILAVLAAFMGYRLQRTVSSRSQVNNLKRAI
ncbi:biotin transporter BioY [Peribacillus sp. SCS-155]|uniref:biotin transporter BioY n=1 Tax=Peribacillus sedimenti TaxID=3115297 RepID=UPI003905E483